MTYRSSLALLDTYQLLRIPAPDRDDQAPAQSELVQQLSRDLRRRCSNDDRVVGPGLRPADSIARNINFDVLYLGLCEFARGPVRQCRDALHGDHPVRQLG